MAEDLPCALRAQAKAVFCSSCVLLVGKIVALLPEIEEALRNNKVGPHVRQWGANNLQSWRVRSGDASVNPSASLVEDMLDATLGGMCCIAKTVADRACAVGRGMADLPCAIGRSMPDSLCGMPGFPGGIFGALLDVLLCFGLVGVGDGTGERECQRGKQEQVAFHDGNPLKRAHTVEAYRS